PDRLVVNVRLGVHSLDVVHPEGQHILVVDGVHDGVRVELVSLGNAYPLEETAQEWTSSPGCKSFGPFHNGYELRLGDLDPAADWIRLDYGPGETLFSFTVELKEGAA